MLVDKRTIIETVLKKKKVDPDVEDEDELMLPAPVKTEISRLKDINESEIFGINPKTANISYMINTEKNRSLIQSKS